jgi:hypothetical protein
MSEICCRFPRIGSFFVALSFNSVLELLMKDTGIHNLVDFVFFFTFHCDKVRWRRFVKTVVLVESKLVDMKNGVELQIVE